MEGIYNRKEVISKYRLTPEEVEELSDDLYYAYVNSIDIYRYACDFATSSGKSYRGYIHPVYFKYFNALGCEVINYDFGVEEFEIKRVSDSTINITNEARIKAKEYVKNIAKKKCNLYEETIINKLNNIIEYIQDGYLQEDKISLESYKDIFKDKLPIEEPVKKLELK
jgi:hypothetical protein